MTKFSKLESVEAKDDRNIHEVGILDKLTNSIIKTSLGLNLLNVGSKDNAVDFLHFKEFDNFSEANYIASLGLGFGRIFEILLILEPDEIRHQVGNSGVYFRR